MATHSKLYWWKGGGWLIMVDIFYNRLHKRTGEGGWLATLSTPLDQPLEMNAVCMAYNNIVLLPDCEASAIKRAEGFGL